MASAGIDPGKDGALVIIDGPSFAPEIHQFVTPTLGKGKREYDLQGMRALLCSHALEHVWIERAQGMRRTVLGRTQGVSSTFSIGAGFGMWLGLLAGLRIPFDVVSSQVWQKAMFLGVSGSDTKAKAAIVAQRLHPHVPWTRTSRCTTFHEGLVDAFCIAEYGRRQMAARGAA
jgi:hypothetical protein